MFRQVRLALQQLEYLGHETSLIVNKRWWRWLSVWFSASFKPIAAYRMSRCLYLLFGRGWVVLRHLLAPLFFILSPWLGLAQCSIEYQSDIGRGLRVLHPQLGIVVSRYTVAGEKLILTGGNLIGQKRKLKMGDISIGNNVLLGAHAIILGPIRIGDRTTIGAGSVAVHSAKGHDVLFGVPAQSVYRRKVESKDQK